MTFGEVHRLTAVMLKKGLHEKLSLGLEKEERAGG